jgi:hypothetical protein
MLNIFPAELARDLFFLFDFHLTHQALVSICISVRRAAVLTRPCIAIQALDVHGQISCDPHSAFVTLLGVLLHNADRYLVFLNFGVFQLYLAVSDFEYLFDMF